METQILRSEMRETSQTINENGLKMILEKVDVNGLTESATAQFYITGGEVENHVGTAYYNGGKFQLGNIRIESPVTEMWQMILGANMTTPEEVVVEETLVEEEAIPEEEPITEE